MKHGRASNRHSNGRHDAADRDVEGVVLALLYFLLIELRRKTQIALDVFLAFHIVGEGHAHGATFVSGAWSDMRLGDHRRSARSEQIEVARRGVRGKPHKVGQGDVEVVALMKIGAVGAGVPVHRQVERVGDVDLRRRTACCVLNRQVADGNSDLFGGTTIPRGGLGLGGLGIRCALVRLFGTGTSGIGRWLLASSGLVSSRRNNLFIRSWSDFGALVAFLGRSLGPGSLFIARRGSLGPGCRNRLRRFRCRGRCRWRVIRDSLQRPPRNAYSERQDDAHEAA